MKKIFLFVSLLLIFLYGCSTNNDKSSGNNIQKNDEQEIEIIYSDDKSINLFINKYNKNYDPDIESNMIVKKHIGGRDRDDVVDITNNDKLDISIYGANKNDSNYKMSVYIDNKEKEKVTNDEFKVEFIKYIRLFDKKLSDNEIDNYWNDMISEYRSYYEINDIEILTSVIDGKVNYFKITSNISF